MLDGTTRELERSGEWHSAYWTAGLGGLLAWFEAEREYGVGLEQAVISGMFDAFYESGREVETRDILRAIAQTVPLSRTMLEEISRLREWCQTRARPASGGGDELVTPELPLVEGELLHPDRFR